MTKKQKAKKAIELLARAYPDASCALAYEKPHELLIATRLSAQCTDKRVNTVTPALFARFPTVEAFARARPSEIEPYIQSCGLFKTKARDIAAMCEMLLERYGGTIPDTIEELTTLPGVGRKTANLICGDLYGKPALVCDTHVIRLTNRLGLTDSKDAAKVEQQLAAVVPPEEGLLMCHRLVRHGRQVCGARKPDCGQCCMREICDYKNKPRDR